MCKHFPGLENLGLARKSLLGNIFYAVGDNSTRFMRRQRHSGRGGTNQKLSGPSARYGHAACAVANGFTLFGGKQEDGTLANDLWLIISTVLSYRTTFYFKFAGITMYKPDSGI